MSRLLTIGVPVVLLVILAAEVALRSLAPKLPKPLDWHYWQAQNKVTAMEQLAQRGGASVAMIGASHMNSAVDAELLTQLVGAKRPVFNAGLNAANTRTVELWTLGVVLPYLRPDLVVFGLNSSEVNESSSGGKRSLDKFEKCYGWRSRRQNSSRAQRLLLWLEGRSFLVRYRRFLQEPTMARRAHPVVSWFGRLRKDPLYLFRKSRGQSDSVSKLGTITGGWFRQVEYHLSDRTRRVLSEEFLNHYEVGGPEFAAFRRLVEGVRAAGVSVLVVLMPVTSDWTDLHSRGERDVERFTRAFAELVAEVNLPFVDLTSVFASNDFFADPAHLNGAGMRRFAEEMTRPILDLMDSDKRSAAGD